MSFRAKRELLAQTAPRYRVASDQEKTIILDEFVAATGYARKYAIRLLNQPITTLPTAIRRPRARTYCKEAQDALVVAWSAANRICAKRLVPFLPELVMSLERHGHLSLTEEVRSQLLAISPATADRILSSVRQNEKPRGMTTTKPGRLLKHQVPVRTFADWDEVRPGFFEADVVAHCGSSMEGAFLSSLVLTDVATGWTECLALRYRSQEAVLLALDRVRQLLPFAMLGVDTDKGCEFLNYELLSYCDREQISFTRGRAYKKNDQCFVEQKNGSIVRQLVGYDRYEGEVAHRQLAELYRAVRLYVNFFQPSMKLMAKQPADGSARRRYDTAQTPFQRLVSSGALGEAETERLNNACATLDPVRLLQQIRALQDALWRHAVLEQGGQRSVPSRQPVHFQLDTCMPSEVNQDYSDQPDVTGEVKYRKFRRSKKPRAPRTWRTRQDPFATVDAELHQWFLDAPESTAKALLHQVQQKYPGQFLDSQVRTLQRRVSLWRRQTIVEFNERVVGDLEIFDVQPLTTLRGVSTTSAATAVVEVG